jgi:hypothetical protein
MFDLDNVTINVLEILDPEAITGAEYFNWFFTLILVFGLVCFGIKVLFDLINRS